MTETFIFFKIWAVFKKCPESSKSIKTGALITETEMDNDWNLNFFSKYSSWHSTHLFQYAFNWSKKLWNSFFDFFKSPPHPLISYHWDESSVKETRKSCAELALKNIEGIINPSPPVYIGCKTSSIFKKCTALWILSFPSSRLVVLPKLIS